MIQKYKLILPVFYTLRQSRQLNTKRFGAPDIFCCLLSICILVKGLNKILMDAQQKDLLYFRLQLQELRYRNFPETTEYNRNPETSAMK